MLERDSSAPLYASALDQGLISALGVLVPYNMSESEFYTRYLEAFAATVANRLGVWSSATVEKSSGGNGREARLQGHAAAESPSGSTKRRADRKSPRSGRSLFIVEVSLSPQVAPRPMPRWLIDSLIADIKGVRVPDLIQDWGSKVTHTTKGGSKGIQLSVVLLRPLERDSDRLVSILVGLSKGRVQEVSLHRVGRFDGRVAFNGHAMAEASAEFE